jgi:hypothetical protein
MSDFVKIMLFYAIISYIIGPFIGYQIKNNLLDAGTGFVIGSIISIILWYIYGKDLISY